MLDFFQGENKVWFYVVPILVFGPIFFTFLWNFALKNLLHTDPRLKEQQRLEREHAERITSRRESKSGRHARSIHPATQPSRYWLGQGAFYFIFMAVLGVFSAWPGYSYVESGWAQVKLSLSHPGQRVEACRERSREELAKLAPNMRAKMECSRERWHVAVEFELDGVLVFRGEARPSGLRRDGSSSFYEKFKVPAGLHTLTVRLNDTGSQSGEYAHALSQSVDIAPGRSLSIGFREDGSGFYVQ